MSLLLMEEKLIEEASTTVLYISRVGREKTQLTECEVSEPPHRVSALAIHQ